MAGAVSGAALLWAAAAGTAAAQASGGASPVVPAPCVAAPCPAGASATVCAGASCPTAGAGTAVSAVRIERTPVFDARQGTVGRLGNALHRTTRERVIRREVLLAAGQPYDSLRAAETARNLRALGIFRRVFVDTVAGDGGPALRVRTQDGWTLRPTASLTRSAGQTAWSAGLEERNFLGTDALVALEYRRTPDRDAFLASWRAPRLLDDRIGLGATVERRSDGRSLLLTGGVPFFALTSRTQVEALAFGFEGTVLRFRDGDPVPSERLRRRFALGRATLARALVASPKGAVRLGLTGQLRRDDFLAAADTGIVPFARSITGVAGVFLSAERADFAVVRNVGSILREEDVAIGPAARVGVLAAPRAFGYAEDGVGLEASVRAGMRLGDGYATASVAANGRFAGGLDSGTVRAAATVVLRSDDRQATVGRAVLGWKRGLVPGEEFDVGLGYGLRAFPIHAFTGDRLVLLGGEHRWTVAEEAFGLLGLGVAAFGEWGGAWYAGEPRRTGGNAGVGLRWAFVRGSEAGVRRVDLVRRFRSDRLPAGWSLVVGEGFTF